MLRVRIQKSITFTRCFLDPGFPDSLPGCPDYRTVWHWHRWPFYRAGYSPREVILLQCFQRSYHYIKTTLSYSRNHLWQKWLLKKQEYKEHHCFGTWYSKIRTNGKREASTGQQRLQWYAAIATKAFSKDGKRQCEQLIDITTDWNVTWHCNIR